MISGLSISTTEAQSSNPIVDLFMKTLIKTIQTPISLDEANPTMSVDIILENEEIFSLDDILRLFIQQFILALYDNRLHLVPEDWETRYPEYSKVLSEVNNVLDLIGKRLLSQIKIKDIRPLINSLTPAALLDLQVLLTKLDDEDEANKENDDSVNEEL
ncbi:unnamed protein product [Rotaria sp. Silwood1]|nr:unnamed protein product [Rotaria sp. Silwood1]CAF1574900.1 unnamed protein product [Rotaria sp. Silwood1]CAF3663453.1 unnamed protein product [Rotaria sp. Silwood1]CAF3684963.1 unnamed protein product [Rotaria sp. Silwood1]CAF4538636.1 unnamed protein product [Rotaria sp. Silwood1]